MTLTKGYGIMSHSFKEYRPMSSLNVGERKLGVLVSMEMELQLLTQSEI